MNDVTLAVDILLEALIDARSTIVDELLEKVRTEEYCLVVQDFALYCALRSTKPTDTIFVHRFAELLRFSRIESSPWIGPGERFSWEPEESEVEHWRSVVSEHNHKE